MFRYGLALFLLPCLAPGDVDLQEVVPVVLTTAERYFDEVPAQPSAADGWVGLYVTDDGTRLEESELEFVPTAQGNQTIYRLVATPAEPRLLISGVDGISPGPATTVRGWPHSLTTEGRMLELPLADDLYRIRLEAVDPHLCDAVVSLHFNGVTQRLYGPEDAVFSCDEPHLSVDWGGDLDRDGKLDLVVGFAFKYSYHPRVLLLSSSAAPGALVAPAAWFDRTAA